MPSTAAAQSASIRPRFEPKRCTSVAGERPASLATSASVSLAGSEAGHGALGGAEDLLVGDGAGAWAHVLDR